MIFFKDKKIIPQPDFAEQAHVHAKALLKIISDQGARKFSCDIDETRKGDAREQTISWRVTVERAD